MDAPQSLAASGQLAADFPPSLPAEPGRHGTCDRGRTRHRWWLWCDTTNTSDPSVCGLGTCCREHCSHSACPEAQDVKPGRALIPETSEGLILIRTLKARVRAAGGREERLRWTESHSSNVTERSPRRHEERGAFGLRRATQGPQGLTLQTARTPPGPRAPWNLNGIAACVKADGSCHALRLCSARQASRGQTPRTVASLLPGSQQDTWS